MTDVKPSVRARPMLLSAGPPLMTATLPPSGRYSAMNSPSCTPMRSLSGPSQLVYSPDWNCRSTSTTGMPAALSELSTAGADSERPAGDDDGVDAAADQVLDVRGELGGVAVRVGADGLDAAVLGLRTDRGVPCR